MKIMQIFLKDFPNNKKITFSYQSDYYYDINITKKPDNKGWIFDWSIKPFPTTFTKKIEELLFTSYKENTEYFVVKNEKDEEIGQLAVGKQQWNNVARIWDINVEKRYNRQGIGNKLITLAETKAREWKCRALVLECQSSNYPAIQFYLNYGFSLTGFDLISYTNQDIKKHEIRLEMSKTLEQES
ncbi:MAG: GNAT family N-acetyltransferase [Promethearchaeota archaeon]